MSNINKIQLPDGVEYEINDARVPSDKTPATQEWVNEQGYRTLTSLLDSTQVIHGADQILLATIIENYILNIDYANTLAFDVSEIVVENSNSGTSSILGTCILGQMILA